MGLFSKEIENQTKLPNRPLLGLSDFTCDIFPLLFDSVKSGRIEMGYLVELVEILVEASDVDLQNLPLEKLLVARVDLLCLKMGLLRLQKEMGERESSQKGRPHFLNEKIELVSKLTGLPEHFIHEDLLFLR